MYDAVNWQIRCGNNW